MMPELVPFVYARFTWEGHGGNVPQPPIAGSPMREIRYGPTDDHPLGRRGLVMLRTWEGLSNGNTLGMIVQDGDVLIDPHDYLMMLTCIHMEPAAVITAPAKLWRKPDEEGWVWAHWKEKASQEIEPDPDFFCFNFTYLPRALLKAAAVANMRSWTFPSVDTQMARVARREKIPIRVADCQPKHMNF